LAVTGKFPEDVSPAIKLFRSGSTAVLVAMSVPDPPSTLVELLLMVVVVPGTIRAKKALVPLGLPKIVGGPGKLLEEVKPAIRASWFTSVAMAKPTSVPLPPR